MYERYPISGIKQSYRHTRESRTVVMPIVIVTILIALVTFYFRSAPEKENEVETAAISEIESTAESSSSTESKGGNDVVPASEQRSNPETLKRSEPVSLLRATPAPLDEDAGVFTAWMAPSQLDAYIRTKNEGFSESFWNRGHWITKVEGRWQNGGHQFRISYEKMPDQDNWQWQYRINMDQQGFFEAMLDFQGQGYFLISKQSFVDGTGRDRYQAVWQRRIEIPSVADNLARDR
ncbi:MAG: hypothetical protein AAGC68_03210 [Verrucomicrobiota bacterium]